VVGHRPDPDHGADGVEPRDGAPNRIGRRAEIDRAREAPQYRRQPVGKFVGDPIDQEGGGPERLGSPSSRAQQVTVKDQWTRHGFRRHFGWSMIFSENRYRFFGIMP